MALPCAFSLLLADARACGVWAVLRAVAGRLYFRGAVAVGHLPGLPTQIGMGLVFIAVAPAGLWKSPWFLEAGWTGHAGGAGAPRRGKLHVEGAGRDWLLPARMPVF